MIVFCSNSTGWNASAGRLWPGGQVDAYIAPIIQHLPEGSYQVRREPLPGAVNVYLSTRDRYENRFREIGKAGVQISHGIADKQYRSGHRTRSYDIITSPGPLHTEQFRRQGVDVGKIRECGYPKLDPVFQGVVQPLERDSRIRVVWAPTHGGGSEAFPHGDRTAPGALATSWWEGDNLLRLLDPEEFDVVRAPHPRHRKDHKATLAEYVNADVVIADGGSTIYESWALGIPVVFPTWISGRRHLGNRARAGGKTLECRIYREKIGYHAAGPDEFASVVELASRVGMGTEEKSFIDDVLPLKVRGRGGKMHAEMLLEVDADG